MKVLLILLCTVTYYCCYGYPVSGDEIPAEILTNKTDDSVEHLLSTTNDTSSNDSFLQHGVFKEMDGAIKGRNKSIKTKIGNIKNKIGGNKDNSGSGKSIGGGRYIGGIRTHSGSGIKDPMIIVWVLLGIVLIVIVTSGLLFLCKRQSNKNERYLNPGCE